MIQLSDPLAFEKERRSNSIVMAAGLIAAVAGFAAYFTISKNLGVVLMIIGVATLVITATISNAFYKINMKEYLDELKRTNKK